MVGVRGVDVLELDPLFRIALEKLESSCGVELEITSGFRAGERGCHGRAMAVDIRCSDSMLRYKIVAEAIRQGFRRIGVYNAHVHLDLCIDLPCPVIWLGVSV